MLTLVRERSELGSLVGRPGETLAQVVHRTLLEMIVSGYFEPGVRLYPVRLAEQFGVSLTPVREALMQLASEGFIDGVQRRGFHVRTPDRRAVTDLWNVRLALELMAGELAVARLRAGELSPGTINELEALQDEIDRDPETIPQHRKHELNSKLHHRLVEMSGNRMLLSTYDGIRLQVMTAWFQGGRQTWLERHVTEAEEHRAIIAALRRQDEAACSAAIRRHLGRSLSDALRDVALRPKGPAHHAGQNSKGRRNNDEA